MTTIKQEYKPVVAITSEEINDSVYLENFFEYEFSNKDCLSVQLNTGNFASVGGIEYVSVVYAQHEYILDKDNNPIDSYYNTINSEIFPVKGLKNGIITFLRRLNSDDPKLSLNSGYTISDIKVIDSGKLEFTNQSLYTNLVLDRFCHLSREKELLTGEQVGRIYQQYIWPVDLLELPKNISYNRYCLMNHLFSVLIGNEYSFKWIKDNHPTDVRFVIKQWVLENYPSYSSIFDQVEEEVLKEKYNIPIK